MADEIFPEEAPFASAVTLRDALARGEVSAVEAATHYLERIAAHEDLGAFVTVTAESALAEARAADERFAARRANPDADALPPLPPLHGMPIAHKDIVEVAGAPTTYGSAALPTVTATADHPVVARLRAAGTISLGKTQVPEFGLNAYSENLVAPPARNPFDLTRTPGGSSGGSAAAVAAGLLPVAPGSDGGGSIRIPALACGLVGLKPGLGTIPGDVVLGTQDDFGAPRLAVSGPLGRTARDAALLMDSMIAPATRATQAAAQTAALVAVQAAAQRLPQGAIGPYEAAVLRADEVTGLTIAVCEASPFDAVFDIGLTPEARRAFDTAAERLAALGHRVSTSGLTYDPEYTEFFTRGWITGLTRIELPAGGEERLTPLARNFLERARERGDQEHRANALRMRKFARSVRKAWGRSDVVLTPGLAMNAPRIGEFTSRDPEDDYMLQCQWTPYTSMVNVSGLPAIAVPVLTNSSGMPMGAQLIGRPGSEAQLLALAAQLEALV